MLLFPSYAALTGGCFYTVLSFPLDAGMGDIGWTPTTRCTSVCQSSYLIPSQIVLGAMSNIPGEAKIKQNNKQRHGKMTCPKSNCIAHPLSITIQLKPPDLPTTDPMSLTFRLKFIRRIISRTKSRRNTTRINSTAFSESREHTVQPCLVIDPSVLPQWPVTGSLPLHWQAALVWVPVSQVLFPLQTALVVNF